MRDHHATIFIDSQSSTRLESVRREWDPVMAAAIPAHVTLVYPQEISTPEALIQRIGDCCARVAPFELQLGDIACFDDPASGVYVEVLDVDGGFAALREEVVQAPFQPIEFVSHVTLVHPRTSKRGLEIWNVRDRLDLSGRFAVRSIAITAYDSSWKVLRDFRLSGSSNERAMGLAREPRSTPRRQSRPG